jgi:hypothetical protein
MPWLAALVAGTCGCATLLTEEQAQAHAQSVVESALVEARAEAGERHAAELAHQRGEHAREQAAGAARLREVERKAQVALEAARADAATRERILRADAEERLDLVRREAEHRREEDVARAREEALQRGRREAEQRIDLSREHDARSRAERRQEALLAFHGAFMDERLLGGRRMKDESATAVQVRHLLDAVMARVEASGYHCIWAQDVGGSRRWGEQGDRLLAPSFSARFQARFSDRMELLSVRDALALLARIYGVEVWLLLDHKALWFVDARAGRAPDPAERLELEFDESRYLDADPDMVASPEAVVPDTSAK